MASSRREVMRFVCERALSDSSLTSSQIRDIARLAVADPLLLDASSRRALLARRRWSVRATDLFVELTPTGPIDAIVAAIATGADIDARNRYGKTALHRAAARGDMRIVGVLLAGGADPNARDIYGETPLSSCVYIRSSAVYTVVARSLLAAGADVTAASHIAKRTALHIAAYNGHIAGVDILLEAGADPNARDANRQTPLHCAVLCSGYDTVKRILDAGSDPNAREKRGNTALHFAIDFFESETVRILLDAGADPDLKNKDGLSPRDEAAYKPGGANVLPLKNGPARPGSVCVLREDA